MSKRNIWDFTGQPLSEVVNFYLKHFKWISGNQRELLRRAIVFGQTCHPPVDKYYWAGIPRIIFALTLYLKWLNTLSATERPRVLDLGSCQPISAFWHLAVPEAAARAEFTYTALANGSYFERSELGTFAADTVAAPLLAESLVFEKGRFDAVIFTEVLEHINLHPQLVLCEINRILKPGGTVILSTPNASSWKKIYALSNGDCNYDSPTFIAEWGHRHEYSYYQVKTMLLRSGFSISQENAVDVYFDDPGGCKPAVQFAFIILSKILTVDIKSAARLFLRRGSGLFFSARKTFDVGKPADTDLMEI